MRKVDFSLRHRISNVIAYRTGCVMTVVDTMTGVDNITVMLHATNNPNDRWILKMRKCKWDFGMESRLLLRSPSSSYRSAKLHQAQSMVSAKRPLPSLRTERVWKGSIYTPPNGEHLALAPITWRFREVNTRTAWIHVPPLKSQSSHASSKTS